MYWPLGAPQVYAANKSINTPSDISEGAAQQEPQGGSDPQTDPILNLRVSRAGNLLTTITNATLNVWQTSPIVLLSCVIRSKSSLKTYGDNVAVCLRPDASIVIVQTSLGFLVTYEIVIDPNVRVYQLQLRDEQIRRPSLAGRPLSDQQRAGQLEVLLRFRMVIKIDAGVSSVLALDDELIVATEKPAAVQCIRWGPEGGKHQTSTELLNRMPWMIKGAGITEMIYDRAMSIFVWINNDGRAYSVQKIPGQGTDAGSSKRLFRGHGFHTPTSEETSAVKCAINARFSLLAVGCASGEVLVYIAKDYVGSIPLSHRLTPPASISTTGPITSVSYSPDGYCLFVGYERGWAMWSVYGKPGGNSFGSDRALSQENEDYWLSGVRNSCWIRGGSEIIISSPDDARMWVLEMAKSAVTGCFSVSNISRMLLHTHSSLMIYRGYDVSDLVSISADPTLWHQTQFPKAYMDGQGPIRCAVISSDGRYVAIAGRRGLAHYSIHSGRWKTFDDPKAENTFAVRGGMCWHHHNLIVAAETGEHHEIRLYSRELGLGISSPVFVEQLPSSIVTMAQSGENSLLVYTNENVLYHFIITATTSTIQAIQVGQIGLHGIVRAPARVRGVTWYIPDQQLRDGDPSQDVVHASVLFLVDAKLVLLQPCKDEQGALKYDMRIIASNVEYFAFMRDQLPLAAATEGETAPLMSEEGERNMMGAENGLRDSLWYFDGQHMQCWTDFQELLKPADIEGSRELPLPISIETDFYPTSVSVERGIVLGMDSDMIQRRDTHFALYRFTIRTQLFLPQVLYYHLSNYDSPAALNLSYQYQRFPYFSHALEVLLHTVLDEEVDTPRSEEDALLPKVLSFLSSFPDYLDILVQCTRKTEVRSWRTLFAHLPPPQDLFEESLQKGLLKTAGGYLLIINTFDELDASPEQCIRLLQRAKQAGDWDLCKELARFLMALDDSGDTLRYAMERLDPGRHPPEEEEEEEEVNGHLSSSDRLKTPRLGSLGAQRDADGDAPHDEANSDQRSSRSAVTSEDNVVSGEEHG